MARVEPYKGLILRTVPKMWRETDEYIYINYHIVERVIYVHEHDGVNDYNTDPENGRIARIYCTHIRFFKYNADDRMEYNCRWDTCSSSKNSFYSSVGGGSVVTEGEEDRWLRQMIKDHIINVLEAGVRE